MVKRQWTILTLATAVFLGISAAQVLQFLVSYITLLIPAYRFDWPVPDWIEGLMPLGIWLPVILLVAFVMIRRERAGLDNAPNDAGEGSPKNEPRSSPTSTYGGPRRAWDEKDPKNPPRSSPTYVDIGDSIKVGEEIPKDSATSRPATEHVKEGDEAAEEPSP